LAENGKLIKEVTPGFRVNYLTRNFEEVTKEGLEELFKLRVGFSNHMGGADRQSQELSIAIQAFHHDHNSFKLASIRRVDHLVEVKKVLR
jgi:hypothetical protein